MLTLLAWSMPTNDELDRSAKTMVRDVGPWVVAVGVVFMPTVWCFRDSEQDHGQRRQSLSYYCSVPPNDKFYGVNMFCG